jgi:hypothetical protein
MDPRDWLEDHVSAWKDASNTNATTKKLKELEGRARGRGPVAHIRTSI